MSKLFKLKEWHTLADAAKRLSTVFEEDVTEADILRLGLDRLLTLSVYFVNHTDARRGEYIDWDGTEWILGPKITNSEISRARDNGWIEEPRDFPRQLKALLDLAPELEKDNYTPLMMSLHVGNEKFIKLSKDVTSINGIWDLTMIGGEGLDVEHEYHRITGGPAVTLQGLDGCFVERDGVVCQLQTSFDDNEFCSGSKAQLEKLKARIAIENIGKSEATKLLNEHKELRKKYLEHRRSKAHRDDYYPAGGLPSDSVLVVRTAELLRFEQSVDAKGNASRPESTRKTDNLLKALNCIARDAYGYKPELEKSTAPKDIADALSKFGHSIDPKTIRGWLKEGENLL